MLGVILASLCVRTSSTATVQCVCVCVHSVTALLKLYLLSPPPPGQYAVLRTHVPNGDASGETCKPNADGYNSCHSQWYGHLSHFLSPPCPPRASDPTSPQCSTHVPISGARPPEWAGLHDHMDRVATAEGGVAVAAWVACHVVSPSSRQVHQQGTSQVSPAHPLPPCKGEPEAPPKSSTPLWLGTILLHKVGGSEYG